MTTFDWDPTQSIIRLIDKTNDTPTLSYDIIANKKLARLVLDEGEDLIPSATLYLHLGASGEFVTATPILVDKTSPDEFLLETKIAQVIGGSNFFTKLQRFRLSTPTIVEDPELGWVLQIPCENIAYQAFHENFLALNEDLEEQVTPFERIDHLISFYNAAYATGGMLFGDVTNNLPNKTSLKFSYTPTSPQSLYESFREVLDRLKEAGAAGGVFKNYYYSIEANPNSTRFFNIRLEEFGLTDSGVTINSTTNINAMLTDRTAQTSDKKRKNLVIVKYHPRSGTLPVEHAKFSSNFLHARFRDEWSASGVYVVGDLVKLTSTAETPNVLRFFRCILNVGPSAITPDASANWNEDFTIIPPWSADAFYTIGEIVTRVLAGPVVRHYRCTAEVGPTATPPESDATKWTAIYTDRPTSIYTNFFSYTPWTADLPAVKQSLANPTSPPTGYIGFALDWNYERQINDLKDYTNRFRLVTGKAVTRTSNAPPTGRELFNGQRILVGTAGTGAFAGHNNQVAEFVNPFFVGPPSGWFFSDNPVNGDTIFDLATAKIKKFDGVNWVDVWTDLNNDKPSPFHLVKSAKLVKGATGIPGQAVQYRFDWREAFLGGNDNNRTSRGVWFNMIYPYPRLDASSANIGFHYGGNGTDAPTNPQVSHANLNKTKTSKFGWNKGLDSETQGRISAHSFKIKIGFFNGNGDTLAEKLYGKANMTMVYARKDLKGRWFFKDFQVPENDEWFPVTIQLPPFGPANLYFSRLDELVQVFGYTLPIDIFVPEKEFAGVAYDWRKNQSWCVFLRETYNNVGMYQGCYRNILDQFDEIRNQGIPLTIRAIEFIATGNWSQLATLAAANLSMNHANITIDELRYVKEGYAIHPETTVSEPRAEIVHLEQETDYLTAKAKAQADFIKNQIYPNERFVNCTGDARIRYGQKVTESGTRVPGSPLSSVVARKKDIIDNKGFTHELFLVKKFTI